jgi:ribulose-phosphate 3-epimerase
MIEIFPSLICADLLDLRQVLKTWEVHVSGFHLDIMDFHFVPNLTFGPDFINAIAAQTSKKLSIHLMVDYPERYFDRLQIHPGDIVSIHAECKSTRGIPDLLKEISHRGWQASLAINPETSLDIFDELSPDHILFMTVHPGFAGQEFLDDLLPKLETLHKKLEGTSITLSVDGGVNLHNAARLVTSGAKQLVIGSALFSSPNPLKTLLELKKIIDLKV